MTSGPIHWTPGLPGSDDRNLEMPKKKYGQSDDLNVCRSKKVFCLKWHNEEKLDSGENVE